MRQRRQQLTQKFGRALANVRAEAEVSQESLAAKAGLHRTYISLVERGRRSPTLDAVEAISRALGRSASEMLGLAEAGR